MITTREVSLAALSALLVLSPLSAQVAGKKSFEFHGKVTSVDTERKRLTVASDPTPGWMGAMTMAYPVSNEDVVGRAKIGDQITAKVYEGDTRLYDVRIASSSNPNAPGLRLEELEAMAIANNPTMAQVQANRQVAAGLLRQAGVYPNPTVGYYGDEIRGGYERGGKQGGFVSQTIVLGGKLQAARRSAQIEARQAETGSQLQETRIRADVRAMFYSVLAAQRLVQVRRNLIQLAEDAVRTSYQLGNVGQADRPDILQAEVEQQQATISVRVAEQNLQAAWRILAAVVGKPDLPVTNLEGDLETIPDLNYDAALASALADSPEIKLAQQAVDHAEAVLVQARKAPIPDLQVTGILAQNYEPLSDFNPKSTGLMGGAQVGVQLPIFDRNQGNIAAAKAQVEIAKQDLVRTKLQIGKNLANIFRDFDSARVTVQQYKTEMLPRAEQAFKLYQANYQNMAGAYPQVLISQRTLFQLEADYVQTLDTAWQNAVLVQSFGLSDGLASPVGGSMMPEVPMGPRGAPAVQ